MIFRRYMWLFIALLSSCGADYQFSEQLRAKERQLPLYAKQISGALVTEDLEFINNLDDPNRFIEDVTFPKIRGYFPRADSATDSAVIILPGGGYKGLSIDWEGIQVAKRLNQIGVTAFVLKYRIPMDKTMVNKSIGPLQDVQQAINLVRSNSQQWGLNTSKIGVLGFSAGGHLAASAAVHFNQAVDPAMKGKNLRPDFQILVYPVISFDQEITHKGSRQNLIGANPTPESIRYFSTELQVTSKSPQAFIVHAGDDKLVPVANSIRYYQALHQHQVPTQLLLLPDGGHGFGLNNSYDWFASLAEWMDNAGLMSKQ
ncbi:alpha/beta hydrolase [uncultured Paraglaciecola sp.]|uniref:alpha/beta hydrolase n=1 Tax=uncultured Paraglaciecola sp. TaxID=1765024 RepID=UPI0026244C68|nr:alpha/beta hydrolase [uncultured Paraglaciecola sp.]